MKPIALALALSLAAGTVSAWPATNLSWDHCAGDGYVGRKTFDCASNTGEDVVVGSWIPAREFSAVSAFMSVVGVSSTTPTLPDWWKFATGGCRARLASATLAALGPPSVCVALMAEGLSVLGELGASGSGIKLGIAGAVPPGAYVSVSAGSEYQIFALRLPHSKSSGTGSCAGCSTPACLALPYFEVDQGDGTKTLIPATGATTATWQPGGYVDTFEPATRLGYALSGFGVTCTTNATPAANRTWGAIKSLYR